MKSAKLKINAVVFQYKVFFKEEYNSFLLQIKDRVLKNDLATAEGVVERAVWEIPETLYNLLLKKLSPDELDWFNKKGKAGGQQYLVKAFKEFKVPEKL